MVVPIAKAPVETPVEASPVVDFPVEASPVVDFPVEAGFLLLWTGPVETLPVPGTIASASFPTSPSLRALLLAVVEQAQ